MSETINIGGGTVGVGLGCRVVEVLGIAVGVRVGLGEKTPAENNPVIIAASKTAKAVIRATLTSLLIIMVRVPYDGLYVVCSTTTQFNFASLYSNFDRA
jgi:hypothetical protein